MPPYPPFSPLPQTGHFSHENEPPSRWSCVMCVISDSVASASDLHPRQVPIQTRSVAGVPRCVIFIIFPFKHPPQQPEALTASNRMSCVIAAHVQPLPQLWRLDDFVWFGHSFSSTPQVPGLSAATGVRGPHVCSGWSAHRLHVLHLSAANGYGAHRWKSHGRGLNWSVMVAGLCCLAGTQPGRRAARGNRCSCPSFRTVGTRLNIPPT